MYQIFNIILDCDMPLPELPKVAKKTENPIIVSKGLDKDFLQTKFDWYHHWKSPDGEICISNAKYNHCYVLRFPNLVDFVIPFTCDSVQYYPSDGIPDETIRHLLLDQIIPRILGQKGKLVLHASAVKLSNGKAIAFFGSTGWGKSTIASSFHEDGASLLTDDCLLIEYLEGKVTCIPNYHGIRLFKDSIEAIYNNDFKLSKVAHYSDKVRLAVPDNLEGKKQKSTILEVIFLINDPAINFQTDTISILKANNANTVMNLLKEIFILDVTDTDLIAKQFKNIGNIISTKQLIYNINYPRKHSLLPKVREKIKDALE